MKKVIALIAVVVVVCVAGAAFAQSQPKNRPNSAPVMPQNQPNRNANYGYGYCPCFNGFNGFNGRGPAEMNRQPMPFDRRQDDNRARDFGNDRGRRDFGFAQDMPQEIRAKVVELEKLHIDLREALSSRPLNKEKALDVHAKIMKLEQEVEAWKFMRRLDNMEAFSRQRDINRNVPPAPKPAPKPAPAPEAVPEVSVEAE